jgi:hypothetical protein
MKAKNQKTFDECLDEAFKNIIRGKLEDVRDALKKFADLDHSIKQANERLRLQKIAETKRKRGVK